MCDKAARWWDGEIKEIRLRLGTTGSENEDLSSTSRAEFTNPESRPSLSNGGQ